jgi:hypothetical protein
MSLALLGNCGFADAFEPAKSKNEWGIDVLTRKMIGARALLDAFLITLKQGRVFQGYFLQTWEPDENPQVCTVTLTYKGLLTGGTPVPTIQTQITAASGSASVSFATENQGIGRAYQTIPLYTQPTQFDNNGQVQTSEVIARRNVYTTGANVEFTYDAVQTVYRYITRGRPAAPRYSVVDSEFIPTVKAARGITADGTSFGKEQGIFLTFQIVVLENVIGFNSSPVIGSPFYECEDVVRKELGTAPII